jgi:hypothetical protein
VLKARSLFCTCKYSYHLYKNIISCRSTTIKENGGLSPTRLGKGEGAERLERGVNLKGLSLRE